MAKPHTIDLEEEVHDLIYVLERVKYHLNKPAGERG